MGSDVYDTIRRDLDAAGIVYRAVRHEPTRTSEESAEARGESVQIGGKAIVMKVGEVFHLLVLSAALKVDSGAIKRKFGVKKVRFASAEELASLTGLEPGSVPPFGRPILPFDLFVDESIRENERIAFNAGSLTQSIVMSVEDYLGYAKPEVFRFSQPA